MGHSASVVSKKYHAPEKDDDEGSEHDSLATVSSFRPTSPQAHADAREFSFGPQGSTVRSREKISSRQGFYQVNGTIPRRTLSSQGHITASSSTLGSQPRSMREVKHFLVKNPELLAGKQAKNLQKRNQFGDDHPPKQIKTKQDLYLSMFNPPIIYGKGVEPDKQLKMNQRLYLQLIYPTASGMKYYYPSVRSNRPKGPNEMVVIRREDFTGPEEYMKRPPRERSRPPLKSIDVPRASPHHGRSQSQQQIIQETSQQGIMSPRYSPRISNGYGLPSSTPIREIQSPRRKGNNYTDVHLPNPPSGKTGKASQRGSKRATMEVERRYEGTANQGRENYRPKKPDEEEIVFNFDVDELGLKKKPEGAFPKDNKDNTVVPLYFRKSLAYNPKYSNGGNILSDPL